MKLKTKKEKGKGADKKKKLFFLLGLLSFTITFFPADVFAEASAVRQLEEMPVQHSGRVKPFQTFAREAVLNLTGTQQYDRRPAAAVVWDWIANPEIWSRRAMIQVPQVLRKEFGLMAVKGRVSPEIILNHKAFVEKVHSAGDRQRQKERLTELERKTLELYERAVTFQNIATGAVPGWIAHPENPLAGWLPLKELSGPSDLNQWLTEYPAEKTFRFMKAAGTLVETWRTDAGSKETADASQKLRQAQQDLFDSKNVVIDSKHLNTELLYNRLHAFGWAWKLYFLAVVLFGISMSMPSALKAGKIFYGTAAAIWASGFLMHIVGFVLRCLVAGRPPVTNMYESIIWVSWAASFFSMILFGVYRAVLIPFTAALVASFALIVAETFPVMLDPSISPLVPVLRSNLWLTVHVLTITMSYGAFALAWGLGHAVILGYARDPQNTVKLKTMAGFLYRALQIGVILLAAGTILGGVWANYSWGRFWGWDPKETWALIALLGYLAVLHGRFAGWLDTFDAAAGSVVAFAGVVMAWYGVNYVLAAGLHSYGFGGGGAPYVLAAAMADILFVFVLRAVYRKKKAAAEANV